MSRTYEDFLSAMQTAFAAHAGMEADDAGDVGIRLKVLAEELFTLQAYADFLERQVFPQTANGLYLQYHAQMRGLARKPPAASSGILEFSAAVPSLLDVVIPKGTLCTAPGDLNCPFATTGNATLKKGERTVRVTAQATIEGSGGNAAAGVVKNLIFPISGIDRVSNPTPFSGGSDEEGDELLRERLLASFPQRSNGANLQYYLEKAMGLEEVVSAGLLPRARGAGTLDVAIRSRVGEADAALLKKVQDAVGENREFCMDVKARSGKEKAVGVAVLVQIRTQDNSAQMSAAVKEALLGYIDALPMGEPLRLSRLGQIMLEISGVKNYRIMSPYSDVVPQADEWMRGTTSITTYR